MGVTSTPSIGLKKPDETELAKDWVINPPQWATVNNLAIVANTQVMAFTFYTPTIIASTLNPNLGAGGTIGEYINFNGIVFGRFRVLFQDAGIVPGSGNYGISLPQVVNATQHTVGNSLTAATGTNTCIGEAYLHDNSASVNCGLAALDTVTISGTSYARLVNETVAGKTTSVVSNNMPFIPANLDAYSGFFFYKT